MTDGRKTRRFIEFAAAVLLLALGAFFILKPGRSVDPVAAARETAPAAESYPGVDHAEVTLRNAMDEDVSYTITEYKSDEIPQTLRLAPGEVRRHPAPDLMVVKFFRDGVEVWRLLSPGRPYSFRYNEKDRIDVWLGAHGQTDAVDLAPFVTTPRAVVERMLALADITEEDILYDLGSGDGRIVIAAAGTYGARAVGIDIDPERIRESEENARAAGVEKRTQFIHGDALALDLSEATVVTMYLLPESNALLRPKLEKELSPGARVVSHNYRMPGWEDNKIAEETIADSTGKEHKIFVYRR
ncbi:MAG: class I SAM-dependent methyltransferase [Acidobacteriota bacterium]|nr:class I SAM-dependent methyltransferase [Acidobacteriota bacterium]